MDVRYRNTFYSIDGAVYQIDIYDASYPPGITLFTTNQEGFTLQYNQVSERIDPIFASTLTVQMLVRSSSDETLLNDMMTAQEERFYVKILKNSALYWVGILLPDLVQISDIAYPYEASITFTDGLGRLKDIDYNTGGSSPVPYGSSRVSIVEHLTTCLGKTGLMAMFGTSDEFLKTVVNWYESHHQYLYYFDPLKYTTISHSVFYSFDDGGNVEYMKTSDVLEMILRTFNARIVQSGGIYHVIQAQDYSRPTTYARSYTKAGAVKTYYAGANFRITPTASTRKTGGITKYFAPFQKVSKKFKNRASTNSNGNLLPVQSLYTTTTDLLNSAYNNDVLSFTGTVHQWYGVNAAGNQPFMIKYKCVVCATLLSNPTVKKYLYGTNNNQSFAWQSSATYIQYVTPYYSAPNWNNTMMVSWTAPALDDEYSVTFQFYVQGYYTQNGQSYNPLFDVTAYIGYECIDFIILASNGLGYSGEESEVEYTATNTGTASKLAYQIPDTNIGDILNYMPQSIGKLMCSNGGASYYNSVSWKAHGIPSTSMPINQLCVNNCLDGQRIPVEKYTGTFINNSITAINSLVMGQNVMVPLALSIAPATDEVTGEWFNCIIPPL